jgi:polyribonucleotide nucleotidyltransferase
MTESPEIGKLYTGPIVRILAFGAFCQILPGKDGLIHVSELDSKFVKNVEDVVKIGDVVTVKVIGVDEQGRVNLSKKRADPNYVPGPDDDKPQERPPRSSRPRR